MGTSERDRKALPQDETGAMGVRSRRMAAIVVMLVVVLLPWQAWAEGSGGSGGSGDPAGSGTGATAPWSWPVAGPHEVLAGFDESNGPYGAGHRGIDVAAPDGQVRAVAAGTVRFTGMVAGRPVISVLHPGGLISTYEPVLASVHTGDAVVQGDLLGTIDPSTAGHCTPVLCLHLGARRGSRYLDPLLLLQDRGPSILLPLDGLDGFGAGSGSGGQDVDGRGRSSGGRGTPTNTAGTDVTATRHAPVRSSATGTAAAPTAAQARGCAWSIVRRSRSAETCV